MEGQKDTLGTVDYLTILVMLLISAGIGIFFRFAGKKQKTAEEYLLAGKNMAVFPVTVSLMASYLSGIAILGTPGEMYRFGTKYAFKVIGLAIGILLSSFIFLPVFFQIQAPTTYEYIERRFGKKSRNLCSFFFVVQQILYLSVVLYAPGLALSAVTNLSIWVSVVSIGVVCTFYCTLGGMKAVLWTDVFQGLLMFLAMFTVIIKGLIEVGGFKEVFKIANEGGRLLVPGLELDPQVRYTIFNLLLQAAIASLSAFGTGQMQMQRLLTIKDLPRARMALYVSIPLSCGLFLVNCLAGVILYSYYAKCDPMTSPTKPISTADQILPYFVVSTLSNYPGLAGLCICGIFSAALSTMSSVINSLSAVAAEDLVRPFFVSWGISKEKTAVTAKVLSAFFGLFCIGLTFLVSKFGNLIQIALTIYTLISAPVLAVFFLGMMTIRSNEKGVIVGLVVSIAFTMWISFASPVHGPPAKYLPVSVEACSSNEFLNSSVIAYNVSSNPEDYAKKDLALSVNTTVAPTKNYKDVFYLYKISFMWYAPISFLSCVAISYSSSILFNLFTGKTENVSEELLSPVLKFTSRIAKEKENVEMFGLSQKKRKGTVQSERK